MGGQLDRMSFYALWRPFCGNVAHRARMGGRDTGRRDTAGGTRRVLGLVARRDALGQQEGRKSVSGLGYPGLALGAVTTRSLGHLINLSLTRADSAALAISLTCL